MKKYKIILSSILLTSIYLGGCSDNETNTDDSNVNTSEEKSNKSEDNNSEESTEEAATEEKTSQGDTTEYEIEMAKVKILEAKLVEPHEYDEENIKRVRVLYEVTSKVNPGDQEAEVSPGTVWMASADATQESEDSINNLNVGSSDIDGEYGDIEQHMFDQIKKGKTVKGIIYYEIQNEEHPVILTFTKGFGGEELGTYEIPVK